MTELSNADVIKFEPSKNGSIDHKEVTLNDLIEVKLPKAPKQLTGDAKKIWKRLGKTLVDCKVITALDEMAFSALCQSYAEYLVAVEMITKLGPVLIGGTNGGMYQNPWVSEKNKALDQIIKLSGEFGLTPRARSKGNISPIGLHQSNTFEQSDLFGQVFQFNADDSHEST